MPAVRRVAQPAALRTVQQELHALLVAQFSYDAGWLTSRQQRFVKAQLKYDQHMGFAPFD